MDLLGIGTAIEGVASLGELGLGIADRIKANKEYKKAQSFFEKNKFAIPESAKAALGNIERQSQGVTLPGEDILRSRLGETTSSAVGASQNVATSAADVLGQLGDIYKNQQHGEQDIMLQGIQRYDTQQGMLRSELNNMANWENQKWIYNVLYPYQQMLGRAGAFSERGAQEIGMGVSGLGQTGANMAQVQGAQDSFDEFMQMLGLGGGEQGQSGSQYGISDTNRTRLNFISGGTAAPSTATWQKQKSLPSIIG